MSQIRQRIVCLSAEAADLDLIEAHAHAAQPDGRDFQIT